MKKMFSYLQKTYFKNWLGLLTSPSYYSEFLKYTTWQLFFFLVSSSLILSFIWSAKIIRFELRNLETNLEAASQEFIEYYPENLSITWNQESLELQPNQEYTIYYPSSIADPTFRASISELSFPSNIARYIPSEVDSDILSSEHADTFFVATPTKLYAQGTENEWQSLPLTDLLENQNFTLTKTDVVTKIKNSFILKASFWHQARLFILIIAPILVFKGLLWNSLIQWLLSYLIVIKLYGVPLSGKQLAKLVIPIVVVTTFIQLLAELMYGQVTVPLFSIGYWVLLLLVTRDISKRKTIQQAK